MQVQPCWKYSHSLGHSSLYYWLLATVFPVYFSPSNIWFKISRSLIELMNLGYKMPAFPSISTEIIHSISKAATCKSHSISAAPVGIQWLWESNKEQKHRLKTNCRGERNWKIIFWEMWHSLEKRLSNLAAVQIFRLLLWEKNSHYECVPKKSFHWQIFT